MGTSDGITPSQENVLLDSGSESAATSSNSINTENNTTPHANLSDIKKIIDANYQNSSDEIVVSLQTGAVTKTLPHKNSSRNRSSGQKSAAKQSKGASNVNPHARAKGVHLPPNTPKRAREHGDTPPSANQKPKKFSGNNMDTPNMVAGQQSQGNSNTGNSSSAANPNARSNGSKLSRNERRKRAKERQAPNAGQTKPLISNETPVHSTVQLPGSLLDTAVGVQPHDSSKIIPHTKPDATVEPPTSATTTYAEVASGHSMAIIDQHKPGQMQLLTQERVNKINSLITDIMLSPAESDTEMPMFEDTRLHSGAMRLRCANDHTRQWLEKIVPTLDPKKLWTGAKLVVMNFKDIPKPHKFNVVFRNISKNPKDIFNLLEKQNKGISTKSWTVLSHTKRDNDTHMTIGVGQDSFDVLLARANSLFCGMGKATFAIVKSCKENQSKLQNRTVTSSHSAQKAGHLPPLQNQTNPSHVEAMDTETHGIGDEQHTDENAKAT